MTAYSNPRTTERNIKDRAVRQRRKPLGDYPQIPTGLGLQYNGIGKYSLWLYRNDQNQIEVVTARFIDVPADTAKLSIQARPDDQEWAVTMEGREVGRYPFSMPVQALWYELCQMVRHDLFQLSDEPELSDEDLFEW